MKSSFSNPSWGGVTNEVEQPRPDTENRSWGEFAKDVAIDALASPVVGAARAGTQLWRSAEDTPGSTAETVDKALGGAQEWLQEQRSDRARALDTQSIDPRGDERSFWKEPIAGSVHALLPSIPYAAAAIGTAGTGLLAEGATAVGMGALQAGDAVNDMRDYADRTPLADLQKSPVFQDLWRKFNGDEGAARNALFKEMLDPKSLALNWLVNTFEVPAFRLGMRPSGAAMRIVDRAKAAGIGAAVGGTQGAIEGGAQAYEEQVGKVRSGQQQAINTDEIAGAMLGGATMGGPMAAFHAVAPTYKATKIGTDITAVAADQLNPDRAGGVPPPAPPGPPAGGVGTAPPGGQRAAINPEGATAPLPQRQPIEEAAAPPEAPPAPPPAPAAPRAPPDDLDQAHTIFKTAKGSNYFVYPDGTTVREKSPHPEHPGDEGWKDRSHQTIYLQPDHANEAGSLQQAEQELAGRRISKRMIVTPNGMVGVQYINGPSAGKVERRTYGRALPGPVEGAIPVELWNNGRTAHFGNPITQVVHRYGEEVGPHEPVGPNLPAPPRMPPGRMVWSSETGFTQPVSVMDRPPVYQDGRWMQPVAYTNPRTGRTEMHLAPQDELLQEHGPPDARPPEVPVRTPEAPLAPQFPEIERPGLPGREDFPVEQAPAAPEEQPTGTLAGNTVLQELRQRLAQRQAQEQEVTASTERARQRRINLERAERMPEIDWRDVRGPEQRPAPPRRPSAVERVVGETIRREKQPLRTVGERLRQREQQRAREAEEGRRTTAFQERARLRQEREQSAAATRRAETEGRVAAEKADRERRGRELERTHPLVGGELRDTRLRKLREDVGAFNNRAREQRDNRFLSRAEREDLRVDRQVLERRLAETPNADALGLELEGVDQHVVKPPTQEQREAQEFKVTPKPPEAETRFERAQQRRDQMVGRGAAQKLALMSSRNELTWQGQPNTAAIPLVRQLENINYRRGKSKKAQLGLPGELYDRLVAAGLIRTPQQIEADTARARETTQALRDHIEQQLDRIEGAKGERGLPRERGWRQAARGVTPAEGRQLVASKYDQANLARRIAKTFIGNNRPTRGLTSYISARDRAHWAEKTPAEKRALRTEARVQAQQDIEELIREVVAQREQEARERTERGLPPTRQATTVEGREVTNKPTVTGRLPTAEQAIRQYREGMQAERQRERGGQAVRTTRDRYVADRESNIRDTIKDAIKKRFIRPERLLGLLDRLTSVSPRPPTRPRNVNFSLDTPQVREVRDRWERANKEWLDAREKQVADAKRLHSALQYTIDRIRKGIADYKKRNNITGRSIEWELARPVWDANTQRYTFRSGSNEERFDWYNYANDLQKMAENLRAMLVGLGEERAPGQRTKPVPLARSVLRSEGQRRLARGEFHAVGQAQLQTYFDELQRYTRFALGEHMQDFAADIRLMLDNKMAEIRLKRETRVEKATEQRGVSRRAAGLPEGYTEPTTRELGGRPSLIGSERALLEDRPGSERTLDTGEFAQPRIAETEAQAGVAGAGEIERAGRWLRDPQTGAIVHSPLTPEDQRVISGGSKMAQEQAVNVVEQQTLAKIEREQRQARQRAIEYAQATGQEYDPAAVAERQRNEVSRTFPLRWGEDLSNLSPQERERRMRIREENLRKAQRRGMDPRAFQDELHSPGTPDHPLISPVESPYGTMERVKDMVAKGQTGVVPREYVTDDFLNRLAVINRDAEVYHAPAVANEQPAYYDTTLDRIVLPSDASPELYVRSALHENVHAATERSLLTDPAFRGEVNDLMQLGINAARRAGHDLDKLPRDLYGLTNPSEFVAEMASNQKFREFLFRVPAPHNEVIQGVKNVLNAAYRVIQKALRKVFGNAKDGDTALDILFYDQSTVLGRSDALLKRKLAQLEREGRPDRSAAINRLGEDDGRRYLNLSEGAQAFRDILRGTFDRAAFNANEANKVLQGGSPSVGMSWRTMDQMTRVGSPEFQQLSHALNREFEEMHGDMTKMRDEDKREIADLARIWSSWNDEGRVRAGTFMIDEGMHTAWADAPLGEGKWYRNMETGEREFQRTGKNAHIEAHQNPDGTYTADNLRDEQVAYQHAAMEQRLAELQRDLGPVADVGKRKGHGGFKEFRDRLYKFTQKREEAVRHDNIRNMWAVTDFMPETMEPRARDRLLDALYNWTDPDTKVTPADLRTIKNAGIKITDPKVVEHRDNIRAERAFQKLQGPYTPFGRAGEWALTGRFQFEKPANALVLKEDINEATGEPADDARFVFPTDEEARAHVREISDKYGIAQMEGGHVWIDTRTGERPRVPDKRHAGGERLATKAEIERYSDPSNAKLDPDLRKLLDPAHLREYSYVTYQPKLLTMHPTQFDAHQAQQQFKQHFGDKLKLTDPKDAFKNDGRQNDQYATTHMQSLINFVRSQAAFQRLTPSEQADQTRNMNLAVEKFIRRKGFMQRHLPRNYVMGVNNHVLQTLDDYSLMSSRFIGKASHASALKNKADAMKDYLKGREYEQGNRNFLAQERVYNAMMRRIHNPTRNPHENIVSRNLDRFMRFTVLKKLPSLQYFAINGTETGLIGGPIMIGRHGWVDTYRTIGKFYKIGGTFIRFAKAAANDLREAWRGGARMTNFLDLFNEAIDKAGSRVQFAEGLKDMLAQASRRNIFDRSASLEYQSAFPTRHKWSDRMLDWGQGMFQALNTAIENNSRFVSLSSAYDLEMRRLLKTQPDMDPVARHQAAVDYAIDVAHQANGVYASYNAPEVFTREGPLGMLGPVVFQFKKWPQRITMIYLRAGLGFVKGLVDLARDGRMTPEHKEMARTFGAMLTMTALVAGALGMPTEPLSTAVNLGFSIGLWKYNWEDAEAGFRAWLYKHGGADMSQLVAHGPLSYATGIDFAGKLSQSQMWAFGSPASNKPRDLYASLMGLFGGATLSSGAEIVQGMQQGFDAIRAYNQGADEVAHKKAMDSFRHLAPVRAIADALAATTDASGTELASGRKMTQQYTPLEYAARVAGFTPTRQSEAREARSAITSMQKRVEAERKSYIDAFAQTTSGLQREQIWQTIQSQWNPANPGAEITRDDLLKARGSRQKAAAEPSTQLGIPQGKRTRALMPMAEAYGYR